MIGDRKSDQYIKQFVEDTSSRKNLDNLVNFIVRVEKGLNCQLSKSLTFTLTRTIILYHERGVRIVSYHELKK